MCIYSHELQSLRRPYHHANQILETSSNRDPPSHLAKCLTAAKRYFEFLLSIPESDYWDLTTPQWGNLVQSILVLTRLTFLLAALNGWDADTTRENVPLGMYLECLCYRIQGLSGTAKTSLSQTASTSSSDSTLPAATTPDLMHFLYLIIQSAKMSYDQSVADIKPNLSVEKGVPVNIACGHCPMTDPRLKPYFEPRKQKAWDSNGGQTQWHAEQEQFHIPALGNLWLTMTGTWAKEF